MNRLLFILCFALLITSCSGEDNNDASIVGRWKLTAWEVADGFDMNNDGIVNTNILNEIECISNETLIFETEGVVSSNKTFNPDIDIALQEGTTDKYVFKVRCDEEGVIGFATTYSLKNTDTVIFNDNESAIVGNQLFRLIKESIKIYNKDFTEVVATKDLTLVYTKQ
ncbi:hypothetical protein [Flavivirga rizhaonensis]|uniref:Lipocalin-like domain-containing protein n=1 Tax=Flavivirga rizhaonensis TaxID=2559571 RepID=A0A4V3P4U1_9FLAO|nr:hypothetical protein [Flavivirga rizhaonensis]TGV02704.1 hypothetical protein EM932_09735 [Flavivirga rizhaonensis]